MTPETNKANKSDFDDSLAFLNSLPQVKKSAAKKVDNPSALNEHFALMESINNSANTSSGASEDDKNKTEPALAKMSSNEGGPGVEKLALSKADAEIGADAPKAQTKKQGKRKGQKKTQAQIQREEKNRVEQERAQAKKAAVLKRQQEDSARKKLEDAKRIQQEKANRRPLSKAIAFVTGKKRATSKNTKD